MPRSGSDVQQDAVDRLADKFIDPTSDVLDMFEVRFARAFRMLRIDALRAAGTSKAGPLEADTDERADALSQPAAAETLLLNKELAEAVDRLAPHLREAVVLVYLMDYEVESNDPSKRTASSICKVSGRTIRARLAEAMLLLKKFMED